MPYTIDEIKKRAIPVAIRYGVDALSLFGSYARGEADDDSDMDFLIQRGDVTDLFAYGGMVSELEEAFDKHIDLVLKDSIKNEDFKETVLRDEVTLYEKQ